VRIRTIHHVPFHTDETCEQYDQRIQDALIKEEEAASKTAMAASKTAVAAMPKTYPSANCGYNIAKHTGCDHIICMLISKQMA
jgi:hypothetical protein